MVKGCQKKVICIKDTGSEMFEEAFFIMKPSKTVYVKRRIWCMKLVAYSKTAECKRVKLSTRQKIRKIQR